MASSFSAKLLRWYADNARALPWVGENDPYRVWLSEVILQQTRVEQGIAYYKRFVEAFPSITHLSEAPETTVMKLWEGLGYYSRARNMHATAQWITKNHGGRFPNTRTELLTLKGIGPYTANAILSYAFKQPYAVTDGNVLRILSRFKGIADPIDKPEGRRQLEALAQKLLDTKQPHIYNQAMMDFGSAVCKPRNPLCQSCPFAKTCYAFAHDAQDQFPVKSVKKKRKVRHLHFFIVWGNGHVVIRQRTASDIWRNLWEFPMLESSTRTDLKHLQTSAGYRKNGLDAFTFEAMGTEKQLLTHQELHCHFYIAGGATRKQLSLINGIAIPLNTLSQYAFPGAIRSFLRRNAYF